MKIRIYTFVIAFCVFHFINMQAWSCMIGYYTDGRTYDTNPAAIIEATGYTPIYVSDISTYDVTQLDVLMINVASNDGPSESLLSRLTHLEFWVRTGGKLIFHDRSSDNSLLIDASSTSLIQNTNTLIYLAPYGTGNNALILGDEESEEDNITTGTLQNTNGFALASTLPSTAVKYLASADDNSKIAAFLYPLGFGYIYYSGIPLDYYFRQTGTSQPGENYRTIYTPNLLKMICMLNIQPEPEPQEGDTCLTAQDLTKLTSPYAATTTGYLPDFYSYCGNYAPDRIFYIDVPAGYQIQIQQLSNTYDSQHSMRYGGDCPGTYKIVCVNDSDTRVETWLNLTGHSERVYWINGAYYRDEHGDFTLWWELTKPDINANWIGDADNDWNNPENWDIKHKPNEIVGVTISANALNYPQLDGQLIVNLESNDTTYKCRQLTIEQGGRITTTDKVINHGIIQINGGIWNHQDNHNDSIVLKNESVLEINDGTLVCGDSNSHEQTDLIVEAGGKLVVNSGTLEITDRLVISDGASFSVVSGHIEVGTYTGTIADSSHVAFEIAGWHSNFYLDQATIVIKRSGDMSNPGLWFHENANISLNNGRFVFSNASDHIQTLYARFNGHSIPNISVQMLDNSNELIFCDSQSTIGQLTITKGTFRLNGTHLSLNGGHSPAIVVGNDAGILLVDDGTLSITQNQASFTALDVQTGGQVEIQTNGILDRQVSIADNYTNVIHIHTDGEFLLNGGTVNIDNQHAEYPWGTTIDSGGLFKMTSGTFNNDAAIHCYGTLRFQGGTFNLASQTDETQSVFNIYDGARIYAQQAVFDGFSQASGLEGIHVYENATIGDTPNDDLNDFDGCTFQNWHQQGQALTVENTESFTMTSPIFMNTEGKTIAKESSGVISVTAYDGNRSGETFDAEPEGCTMNYVNWDNTVRISATNNTGTAIYPANGQTRYYASNTQIEISGMAENGQSILWIAAPTGSTHPEYGESASESITLLKNANITWYSGTAGRWIGLKNTKWDEPSNWADHKVPTMNTPVSIDSGCTYYPILDQSLSINSDKGVYKCRSISLSSDITFTTNANVYCYSLINIQQASWIHSGNTIDSFQIDAGGKLTLNNAAFISSGLAMINDGQFEVIESAVDLSYGIHNENGAIEILNSTLYFGKDSNLDDISFKVEGNTMLKGSNSRLIFQGDAGESNPCIQFHPEAQIVLENTDIIFQLHENQDTMHADFAGKTVDNVYIQMPKETQTFKLINRSAEMNHLFVDNGIFDVNGMTLSLLGDATALKIGNKNQSKALLNMASGKIEVNNSQTDIALHIIENGHFLISGGEFERNLEKAESDKMIWIESGVFEQTGGTVFIDNQKKDYHCDVFIDPQGIFKLSGGTFQNDGRINCSGFMDLDGGTIKMSSNSNIINGTIHIEDGRIHAQNTRFQGTGVLVYENASVGTDSGNDNDDFDNCTFEDWSGSALTFSNSESFTITNPSFSNTNTNITKKTNGFIEVVGVSTDTHFGEAFDSDPEGSTINKINWENTRTLSAESATALAISPASNEIVYYASETTAHATGELLTGSVINWAITPEMSSSPSNGDSTSAEFTIKENAKITWYSGVPGHWTGRTSEEWTNPENWSDHRVPNDKFDVVISGNNPHYPVLNEPLYINNSGTIQCRSLSIESGATLTVQSTVMAYSIIEIYGNWIQETDSDNAIQLFDNSQLLLNNASFIIKRTSNELLTDVLIHKGARFQIQNSALTTQGRIINKGSIIMNQQAKWHVDNNFDNAIELQDGSSLEFSDSELFIGNAAIHSETDVLIESGASLTLNGGTISIVNALKNSGHLIVDNGTIQVGTYEGSASGNFDTCFDIQESGHFTLNNDDAKIEIKGASGKNNPGLYFHEQADIVINGGEIVFSNARQENQLFAIPNNHDLPLVTVDLTDVDHEVVFADSNHQMKELIINRGTLRLDNNIINFTGNNSPTIKIGNDEGDNDAKLLVENGSIQMNQNGSNLKAMEIQSDGIIEILSDGSLERQRSIEDSRSDVIYIKGGGAFYLNGGHVTLNNQQSQYGWGMTIDINGLFQMNGGIFNNDASVICHGTMQFYGGTFNLVSTTDKNVASFQIESNGHIEARDTTFDHFSKVSGLSGITIDSNASIGDSSGDDDLDFDGCTFKNWHLQGVALTVNNSESFTIVNPVFENSDGKSITTTTATIQVTGANLGSRGGEAFDAEFEGSTHNQINWPDTISLYGRENSAQALHPDNGTYSYYAANTQISVSGQTVEGHSSLLWEITPSGSSIPESGESSPSKITLLGNGSITWFSGEFGLWTGEKSSDWSDKANWDDHKIPKISTGVIIQGNCNHYPVLDESLSINGTEGTNQCKSIHLQQGATLTTLSTVYCYSLVHMTDASWFHSANQLDAFQVGANGQLLLDNSEIVIGHEAPLAGLTIKNEGQFLANNSSTVKISHGFYMESNASVDISNTDFSIGLGESLTDPIWTIAENAQLNLLNSTVNIKGCANIEEMSLHFHTHANISFENTPMYFAIKDQQYDTMRADFGSHTVNDIYIQMARDDQALKLDTNTVIADHLFIEKGIFENNGATLQITGNGTAIVIGNEASEMEARLKMTSGNIQITGQSPDICAMHIHHNGIFEMEDGTFSRNIFLEDSFDKVLLIEGIYNQKGGTFTVNNQHDNEHWNIWLDKKGTFKLSGGLFENDSRIRCSGLMDLDGGHIKVSSSKNETETGFDIFGKIQAQNTKFSRYSHSSATSGISVHPYATVGTSIGDDDDDFDLCQFEDWYINGYALSVSNGESFTIAHPVFTNSDGYNINADSNIYVTGLSFGNRGGEEFDCDKEGGTVNKIHWEDTRKLVGKNGTATALSPSMNETFYYGQNTVAKAEGQILTGTSIHWHIEPPESASPSEGDGNSASFTINEHAEIIWYSGFPGVWTGKDSSEWNHPGNWSDYEVPDHTIDVIIHANVPHSPIINEPLYVNSSEGRFQCRSLKLLNDATLTSTSQVIAYSGIEMIEANWFQETNENDALVLNNGASMNIIDASLMIGLPHINKQTCIKINNGGALKLESGLVTLSDRFHVGTEGVFQMSGGIMILGAESNALSTVTGMQPDTSGLFQVDADAHISILDGTVEIQTSWDQTQVLRFDSAAQVDSVKGEWIFISRGLGALKTYADFGEHEVYQVRLKMGQADHCLALSDHDAWFNELKIQKGQFQLNSQTLSFKGAGPSIIVGDQAGTNDATLLLKNGEFIQINQAVDDVKALLIQSDGQFLMSGGQLNRNVFVEDDFDYVIHITANGLYEQTGGEVVINNQSDDHYWGIWIDKQANFNLHGGSFFNDARTWCFGNMQVVDAIYKMASSENETKASFSLENEGNIQAKNASFYNMFSEKGILIKAGARIGQSVDDDDYDFDQCLFENWSHLGAAITVENTESFTMVHAVFNNNGGFNVNKQTAGQIWVTGQSSGSWGGEFHDSDIEGGMTNYIHWEDTVSLTGQSISGEAVHPGDQQTVYYMSGSEISASGKGYPLIWEVSPSESVSITAGEGTPAQFVLNNNATIQWYSIKPGMWRGTVSSDWHDPMNWDDNKIPSETQDVTIPYTYTNALIVTKPAVCANLTMKEASQLTIQSDLSIHGHLIMESSAQLNNGDATLEIYGDWHNDGIFNAQTGTVEFLGYSNCQILQNADAPMTFNRLIINKQTLAVLSFGAVSIQKEFILKTGVPHFTSSLEYASGARLTYASSQEQTTGTELNSPSLPSEIHINSDAGVYLSKDLSIKDALLFSKGYLVLGDYDLHIQEGAEVDGSFSHNTSIVTNGSGAYIAEINQPNTLFFPVGSINAASGFAPFTIVFHDGDFSNGQVRMQTVNDKPMENNSLSNYSDQYWEVASSGIINYTCTVMADLDNNNIQGESLYFGRWNGQNWYVLDPIHDQSPRFSGEVNAFGLFTGGEYNTFASRIILSGFMDHFCGVKAGGVSDEKSYAISGNNLLDDIIIKPPEQFEISTQSGSEFITFPQQLRLSPINSQIPETQIFVRFRPSGDESVQDVIIHSSENAMTQQVLASGSGVFIRTITLSAPTTSENLQIKLEFDPEIFEYDHVLDGGDDIRFKKGSQNLPYWIQQWDPEGTSIIWVRVLDADVSSFDMEYGEDIMPPVSNGEETFALYDDFSGTELDTEKWQTKNVNTMLSGGSLIVEMRNDSGGISSIQSFESTETCSYAAVYKASVNSNNYFTLFGFSEGTDPWVKRTGIYGYKPSTLFGKQSGATSTSHESNKSIALYDENISHLMTIALNQGYGFDDNYIEHEGDPVLTAHAAISTYELGGSATVDWMFVYKNATPQINATIGAECNMPGGGIWLGSISSDWSNPKNWNTGGTPKASDNVTIDANCPNMPRLTATSNCKNIEIKRNASLNLSNYQLNVYGEWKNNGTLIPQNGTVCFKGTIDVDASGLGPETQIVGNVSDTQKYEYLGYYYLGYKFKVTEDITVFSFRHYFGREVSLWSDRGSLLATVTTNKTGGQWSVLELSEPLTLTGNESYVLAAFTGGNPYYLSSEIESGFANGNIQESRYSSGQSFPDTLSSVQWWMVDLIYKTGSGTGFENFNQLIVQKTGDHYVELKNVHIENRLTMVSGNLLIKNMLTYSSDAALEYAIDTNYTTSHEFPAVEGPNNLIINGAGTVNLDFDRHIDGRLSLMNGKLQLGKNNLSLGPDASVKISGQDAFLVTDDTGKLRQHLDNTRTCIFPLGYTSFMPLTLDIHSAQLEDQAYIDVSLHDTSYSVSKPPESLSPLNRYWQIEQSGISDMSCDIHAVYADDNIPETANEKYFMGDYKDINDQWFSLGRVDLQGNLFEGNAIDPQIVTAYEYDLANHLPSGESKTISILENESYPFTASDFGFSDNDPYDTFKAIRITRLPQPGNLIYQTLNVENMQIFEVSALNQLTFKPGYDDSGLNYTSFEFQVQDSELGWSEASYTITFNVIRINKAPVMSLSGTIYRRVSEDLSPTSWSKPYISANDPDGDLLTWILVTPPEHGIAKVSGTGTEPSALQYTPDANYFGIDQWVFGVYDTAIEPLSDTIVVEVTVESVNDAPVFTCQQTQLTLDEDFVGAVDIEVIPVPVPENEKTEEVYYVIIPETNAIVHTVIDEHTGKLTLNAIENKSGNAYIDIVANDNQVLNSTARQTISITIVAVNDPPLFELDQTEISVNEDFTQTYVVNVIPESVPQNETSQSVHYYLSPSQIEFVNLSMDSDTGQLTITGIPDANGSGIVEIWADDTQSENNLVHRSLLINVEPVNDPPSFYLNMTQVRLVQDFEQTITITPYFEHIPVDEQSETHVFRLSPTVTYANVIIDPNTGIIKITSIDNETGNTTIVVTADDNQMEHNTATASFELNVLEKMPPLSIQVARDIVQLDEDFPQEEQVEVNLETDSEHPNRSASFSLSPTQIDCANLSIDPDTGTVTINNIPDQNGTQEITVLAVDNSDPMITATDTFILQIDSINDPPDFELSESIIQCQENQDQPIVIQILPAQTPQDEKGQSVTYSITPLDSDLLDISLNTLQKTIQIIPKLNQNGVSTFTVIARENASEFAESTQQFSVTVLDVNSPPKFTVIPQAIENQEDFETITLTVDAMIQPPDEQTQEVTYTISPESLDFVKLHIDEKSGQVTIESIKDLFGAATLTLTAHESPVDENADYSQQIDITILSVNDQPIFQINQTDIKLVEDFESTEIITITANTPPINEEDQIVTYRLSPKTIAFADISIDESNDTVSINSLKDLNGSATISIFADDHSDVNNQYSRSFNLEVSAVNDPPHFTLSQTAVSLYEDFSGSTTIYAHAMDPPLDESTQGISYKISPPQCDFAKVEIIPDSGEIHITSKPNQHGYQRIEVTANDMQAVNNTAVQYLDLTVISVNDPPLFSLSKTQIILDEDCPTPTIVDIIPDIQSADESEPVSYNLTPNSVDFVDIFVDSNAKKIQIRTIPDKIGYQDFTITADDHQSTNNNAKTTFVISVEPVNDPPVFSLQQTSVNLLEDFDAPFTMTVIKGAIPEDELNQEVSYEITPKESDLAAYEINATTGQLTITSLHNANGSQSLTIIANDHQSIRNTFAQSFKLNITPVNDTPTFRLDQNEVILDEDFSGIQTLPWEFIDVPEDELSQTVEFHLSPSTCDFADIQVDHNTEMRFQSIKDLNGSADFLLIADDQQSQNSQYSQPFRFVVRPVNDTPAFALSSDALTVVEDFEGDQTIEVIPLPAPSDETDDLIRYALSPAETPFAFVHINENDGKITFRSTQNEYGVQVFTVTANDYKDTNALYHQQLTLTVLPDNDPPVFTLSRSSVNVDEDFIGKQSIHVIPGLTPSNEYEQTTYSLNPSSVNFALIDIDPQSGLIEIQSLNNGNGSQMILVIADDGGDQNNTAAVSFSLNIEPINDPPIFQLSENILELTEDFTETQTIKCNLDPSPLDEQTQVVQFSYQTQPPNLVDIILNQKDGIMSIAPIPNANGTQIITVISNDGQRYQAQHEEELTIHIEAVNDLPYFSLSQTEISVAQNFTQTQWIEATPNAVPSDEIIQQVTYQLFPEKSSIVNASIDPFTGKIGLTAMTNQSGTQVYTVTASDGLAETSEFFTITVRRVSSIYVNFITTDDREGYAPFEVSFVAQVQGNVSRYEWQFGDGTSSTNANPKHVYNTPGIYTVRLTAFGADGSKTTEKANYIWIKSRKIMGKVLTNDSEMGLSEYTVEVWQEGTILKSTLTDLDGHYILDGLPKASQLIVSAWPPYGETTYFYQYYNQKDSVDHADKLSTEENDLTDINFLLERALDIGIQGCVYGISGDPDSGIQGIQVDVYSEITMFGMTALTDENGCYSFVHLKNAVDYRVSVWSETLLKDYYYVVPDASQIGQVNPMYSVSRWQKASLVEPTRPPVQKIDIILDKNANERGIIVGTVYRSDNVKLAGIRVNAKSEIVNDQNSALSDANGKYTISELTPVTEAENGYIVEIDTPNYPYQAFSRADLDTIPVRVVTGRTDIDFYLRTLRKISGTINSQCDEDIHARVVASSNSNTYEVHSDMNGNYAIDNLLPASNYTVAVFPENAPVVYYPDMDNSNEAVLLNLLNKNQTGIDFTVLPPSKLLKVIEGLQVLAGMRENSCYALDMDGDGTIGLRDVIYVLGRISK
jgi:PKD repeat protein